MSLGVNLGCHFCQPTFVLSPERYLHDSSDGLQHFETIEEAARCVADIVGHPIEPSVETIDAALDDYLEVHEDDDTWYSFHEFIEDWEG